MEPEQFDVPAAHEREMAAQRALIHPFDLAGCSIVYIHRPMNEFEIKQATVEHCFESWPDQVQDDITRELDRWKARNAAAKVKAVTLGIRDGACTVALHWR